MSHQHTFTGRVDELQLLARCLHLAAEGDPQIVLLEGPRGIGKSALLQHFRRRAGERERPEWVIPVEPPPEGGYLPVARAATAVSLLHRLSEREGRFAAARELLPTWLSALPVVGNAIAAVIATAQAVRRARRGAIGPGRLPVEGPTRVLLDEAARHPLVVTCDDLHRVEAAGIADLERLFSGPGRVRLLFVGAWRSGQGEDPLIQRLVRSLPNGAVHHRRLAELSPAELEVWLGRRFPGVSVPPSFLEWLHGRTGGLPAAVLETLEELTGSGAIRFVHRHWEIRFSPAAPPPPESLAPASLPPTGVDEETLELLRAASGLAPEFSGTALSRLLGRDELEVEDRLAMAAHRGLLRSLGEIDEPDGDISTIYCFASAHFRASLSRALPRPPPLEQPVTSPRGG